MTTRRWLLLLVGFASALAVLGTAGCGSSAPTTTTVGPAAASASSASASVSATAGASATTAPSYRGQTLVVSAASSLTAVLTEFAATFEQQTGAKVSYNFAASGVLQKQIEGGAPVDVFASASPANMDPLVTAGLVQAPTVATFAGNEIVLAVPATSTLGINSFADLAKPDVKRIATGDPAAAPHGRSAMMVLTNLGLLDAVKPKLIYSANASQTYEYVSRGEVDAAILFASDVYGKTDVRMVEKAPAATYDPVKYVVGVVTASKEGALGRAFIDALMAPEGQAVFAKYGFKVAQ